MGDLGDLGESDDNVEKLCWGTGDESQDTEKDGIVGKVIGGDEASTVQHTQSEDDDTPEPLALLAIHAAMHMLFLPQFTCDFYEESEGLDDDSVSSIKNEGEKKKIKDDEAIESEVGLNDIQYAQHGISLKPRPACILWAPGCGVKKLKVRF